MKNWKTTLAGLVTGLPFLIDAVMQAYASGYFTDQKGWQLFGSIAWIVVTALVKDHDATGGKRIIGGSTPPPIKDEK
jgi:hypothetical protein